MYFQSLSWSLFKNVRIWLVCHRETWGICSQHKPYLSSQLKFYIKLCTKLLTCFVLEYICPMFSIISWGSGEIFHVFSVYIVVFQASTGKKLWKKHGKIHGTQKSDATHSASLQNKTVAVFTFGILLNPLPIRRANYAHHLGLSPLDLKIFCRAISLAKSINSKSH